MKFFDQLQEATREDREALYAVPVIREALSGQVGLEGYVAFLTQAYYHVRHTVPLMMACGAHLPSSLEWLRKALDAGVAGARERAEELLAQRRQPGPLARLLDRLRQ